MDELKQVILVRDDLKMSKGKVAAQVAHAAVEAVLKSEKSKISNWRNQGMKKITLKVLSEQDLYKFLQIAKDNNLKTALIKDAGRTQIPKGTTTCLAIGPDKSNLIDNITGQLKNF